MSRIGRSPVIVPENVTVSIDSEFIKVVGPKGELSQFTMPGIKIAQNDNILQISRTSDEQIHRSKHGLMRSLLANMVTGVTTGFNKKLELQGVGYKVALQGDSLKLNLGFSHVVTYHIPSDIKITVEQNTITISGISKQRVGQIAAEIRSLKKPEPYKGKGIRYSGERIIRKSGKSGKEK